MNLFKTIILSFLIFGASTGFAQVNLGIKGGANFNFHGLSSDSLTATFNSPVSFSGGAFIRLKVKKISLQTEGLFIGRKGTITSGSQEANIKFYSFDLPVMLGYKLVDLKAVKLRVNAGIIPSFHIKSIGDLEGANFEDSFYSAAAGLSIDVPLFLFDIRYQGALGDYYTLQNINSQSSLTNHLLTVSVGWKIL